MHFISRNSYFVPYVKNDVYQGVDCEWIVKTNIIQESFNQVEDRTVLSPFYVYQNNEYII